MCTFSELPACQTRPESPDVTSTAVIIIIIIIIIQCISLLIVTTLLAPPAVDVNVLQRHKDIKTSQQFVWYGMIHLTQPNQSAIYKTKKTHKFDLCKNLTSDNIKHESVIFRVLWLFSFCVLLGMTADRPIYHRLFVTSVKLVRRSIFTEYWKQQRRQTAVHRNSYVHMDSVVPDDGHVTPLFELPVSVVHITALS